MRAPSSLGFLGSSLRPSSPRTRRDIASRVPCQDSAASVRVVRTRRVAATSLARVVRSLSDARPNRWRARRRVGDVPNEAFTRLAPALYLGRAPVDAADAASLRALHVDAVICLVQEHEPYLPPAAYGARHALHLPTPDYHSPTARQLEAAVNFAEEHGDRVLLVHCREGKGRSAVCAALILAYRNGLPLREAHRQIRRLRWVSSFHSSQWRAARRFAHSPLTSAGSKTES